MAYTLADLPHMNTLQYKCYIFWVQFFTHKARDFHWNLVSHLALHPSNVEYLTNVSLFLHAVVVYYNRSIAQAIWLVAHTGKHCPTSSHITALALSVNDKMIANYPTGDDGVDKRVQSNQQLWVSNDATGHNTSVNGQHGKTEEQMDEQTNRLPDTIITLCTYHLF